MRVLPFRSKKERGEEIDGKRAGNKNGGGDQTDIHAAGAAGRTPRPPRNRRVSTGGVANTRRPGRRR